VKLILDYHGINIQTEKLLDQSQIKSKKNALDIIKERESCSLSELIFLDDNLTHLLEPFKAGYQVYLTSWGNVLEEFLVSASEIGLPKISINELHMFDEI